MEVKKIIEEAIGTLAVEMRQSFVALEIKMDDKIDALAIAVKHGFDGVTEEFKNVRAEMAEGFNNVENELTTIKFQSTNLDPRVSILEKKVTIIGIKLGLQS